MRSMRTISWIVVALFVVCFAWVATASSAAPQTPAQCTQAKAEYEKAQKQLAGLQNQLDRAQKALADCETAAKQAKTAPNCGAQSEKAKELTQQVAAQKNVVASRQEDMQAACKK